MIKKFQNTSIDLYINNIKINTSDCKISIVKLEENVSLQLPLLELCLESFNEAIISYIYDGVPIGIKFRVENKETQLFNFRILNHYTSETSQSAIIKIIAYFDISNINYSTFYSNNNSSSNIATYIASKANLKYDIDITNDIQSWICPGKTLFDMLFDMSYNAWSNNSSCIIPCFTQNTLKYVDISQRIQKPYIIRFFSDETLIKNLSTDVVYDNDLENSSKSGISNTIGGYGLMGGNFSIETGNFDTFNNSISLIKSTDKTNLNLDLIKNQRSESLPLNCGNTHLNYYSAKLQNIRIKTLYSVSIEVVTQYLTNLKLLDPVELVVNKPNGDINFRLSGKYLVERIRYIKGQGSDSTLLFIYNLTRPGSNIEHGAESSNIRLK